MGYQAERKADEWKDSNRKKKLRIKNCSMSSFLYVFIEMNYFRNQNADYELNYIKLTTGLLREEK